MPEHDKSLDILGVKPIAKSVEKVTDATLKGSGAFLSRICLPAAEELGLLLQDKVKVWRADNAAKTMRKAEDKYKKIHGDKDLKAHPLISWRIIENSSWAMHDELQEIWAGLLTSTCTEDGEDDSNMIFINLVAQLTEVQIRVLNYAVTNAEFNIHDYDLITANELVINIDKLIEITNVKDISRLDRELDYLSSIELIRTADIFSGGGGIILNSEEAKPKVIITPGPLSIQLYVRCQGYIGNPKEYFGL
jgi:hypothetical protein